MVNHIQTLLAAALAFLVLNLWLPPAHGQEAAPPKPRSIARVEGPQGQKILLSDQQGACGAGEGMALFIAPNGDRVPGCWHLYAGRVWIAFVDGDVIALPKEAFTFQEV